MPDFAVEAVYDLTVPSLQRRIKVAWFVWITRFCLENNPDGDARDEAMATPSTRVSHYRGLK